MIVKAIELERTLGYTLLFMGGFSIGIELSLILFPKPEYPLSFSNLIIAISITTFGYLMTTKWWATKVL